MTKAERTRQLIIEKTAPLFNRHGYAGTSLNDITQATGLTRGGIYGNFENKDAVALAAFDYNQGQISSLVTSKIKQQAKAIDKLMAYLTVFGNPDLAPVLTNGCPILNTATEADDTHPELRKKAVLALHRWQRSIEIIIKEGQERKELKKNIDTKEFALAFIALIEGGVMQAKVTGSRDGLNAAVNVLRNMIKDLKKK
jgi:TetR/AcrR family transcriptional repressor of nem operon